MQDTTQPEPTAGGVDPPAPRRRIRVAVVILLFLLPLFFIDWRATNEWLMYSRPEETHYGFRARFPRVSWWPGPGVIVPPQECPRCRVGNHERCAGTIGELVFGRFTPADAPSPPVRPRNLQTMFSGQVSVGGKEMRCDQMTIEGVTITPDTFTCDCCE